MQIVKDFFQTEIKIPLGLILALVVSIFAFGFVSGCNFNKPKDISKDVTIDVETTGKLEGTVTNKQVTVKLDTKYVYITNKVNTTLGDITTVNTASRNLFAYRHQLFLSADIGMKINQPIEFGLGLDYLYTRHLVSAAFTFDTKKNYGFRVGYGYAFFRK